MTMQRINHFDPITRTGKNLDTVRRERLSVRIYRWLNWWEERRVKHRTRVHLKDLEPHLLKDIGLTDQQRDQEVAKGYDVRIGKHWLF